MYLKVYGKDKIMANKSVFKFNSKFEFFLHSSVRWFFWNFGHQLRIFSLISFTERVRVISTTVVRGQGWEALSQLVRSAVWVRAGGGGTCATRPSQGVRRAVWCGAVGCGGVLWGVELLPRVPISNNLRSAQSATSRHAANALIIVPYRQWTSFLLWICIFSGACSIFKLGVI